MISQKHQALKHYFGYDEFRPQQEEIIDTVLDGRDCLVLMPTGGGKSICYQIPAILKEGIALVISPLIALMKDQVEALKGNGVEAEYLNSTLSAQEQDGVFWKARLGKLKLLYISPERLFAGNTLDHIRNWKISMIAVDESHCISSWGHDFRPEYRQLKILKQVFPGIPVIALTATADRVTRRDIMRQLDMAQSRIFISSFDRPNLSLTVLPGKKRLQQIESFLNKRPRQAGIIYCLSRKTTESVAASLQKLGFRTGCYHAGLPQEIRAGVQEDFLNDNIQIIVATIAFGMGIDKSNVRWVIHYNLPSNVESYYQEIGRAGRDGLQADTVLFYSYQDVIMRQEMIANSEQPAEQKELLMAKLNRIKQYADADICRRRILLSYFNESVLQDCGNCDVCHNPRSRFDGTILAQKALSAVARTDQKIAMTMVIDILRGSRNMNVTRHGYDRLPTFGVGRDVRGDEWADYLGQMLNSGIVDIAYDEGHSLKLNEVSHQVLKKGMKVDLVKFIPLAERKAREEERAPKEKPKKEIIRDALFDRLRQLRKQLADGLRIPPYQVFHDTTLSEMAARKPVSEMQMKQISGVGDEKFRRFGELFISEILLFEKETRRTEKSSKQGDTFLKTMELYNEGFSLEEIAQARNLSPATVLAHLIRLSDDGQPVVLEGLISENARKQIIHALDQLGAGKNDPLKPVYEFLDEQFSYNEIRVAMAIREKSILN